MNFEAQGGPGGEMPVAVEDPRTFDQLWIGLAVWMGQGLDFDLLNRRRRLRGGRRDARYDTDGASRQCTESGAH
jgi:hypothetical protein